MKIGEKMKKYFFSIVALMMAMSVTAQTMTIHQKREFYRKVNTLFNDYAQSASLSDESEEYTFRKLFINNELEVGNDLMSLSREPLITVDEYVGLIQKAKRVNVTVRNIRKDGPIEDNDDVWTLPIAFEKAISYSNCGTLFSSYDYFGEYYRLRAVVSLNKGTGECYISELLLDPKYTPLKFPENFTVLERTLEDENKRNYMRDNRLTINGRDVRWNLYGQVMLRPGDKIKYNNYEVDREVITEGKCGGTKIHAKYSDHRYRIRPNVGFALSGFNKLSDAGENITTSNNGEIGFGVDIGYVLPSTGKLDIGFFIGVGISLNKLKMTMEPGSEEILNCTADEDGESYTRHYEIKGNGITQELKATDIAIPIYADFEYKITPQFSAYADLGLKIQTSSGKWSATADNYETYGIYEGYGNIPLIIKGDVNLNGFGDWSNKSFVIDETGWNSKMTFGVLAGLGVRMNITKSFAIDAGIQYVMGGKSWDGGNGKSAFSYTLPDNYEKMSKEEKAQGDKVNLLNKTGGIKRNAIRVAASVIYKF